MRMWIKLGIHHRDSLWGVGGGGISTAEPRLRRDEISSVGL